jgi:hypothetical protein
LITSPVWSYLPSTFTRNYGYPGYLEVGGYNLSNAEYSAIHWVPTPVVAATPDAWIAEVGGISMTTGPYVDLAIQTNKTLTDNSAVSTFAFTTGSQFIGLNTKVWTNLCNAL